MIKGGIRSLTASRSLMSFPRTKKVWIHRGGFQKKGDSWEGNFFFSILKFCISDKKGVNLCRELFDYFFSCRRQSRALGDHPQNPKRG